MGGLGGEGGAWVLEGEAQGEVLDSEGMRCWMEGRFSVHVHYGMGVRVEVGREGVGRLLEGGDSGDEGKDGEGGGGEVIGGRGQW